MAESVTEEKKVISNRKKYYITLAFIMVINIIMSLSLMTITRNALREQIDQRMLDIANTAAYMLDGDEIKHLTADDENTEEYQKALEILRSFQDNIQLDYIYGVKPEADGTFTFTIDPAEDPGEFGTQVVSTDALRTAAGGTPAVDKMPYTDEWGTFYSAYSPIFDSGGAIVGIVAVDFDAEWINGKMSTSLLFAVVFTLLAVTVALMFLRETEQKRFIDMTKKIAYIDPLTRVKSKQAYVEAIDLLEKDLEDELVSEFGVVVFDLNGLKQINDTLGHEEGDRFIKEGCTMICKAFARSSIYRIGGDEFVAILRGVDYANRETIIRDFEKMMEEHVRNGGIVVSSGMDIYNEVYDSGFSAVFKRADQKMYRRKKFLKEVVANSDAPSEAGSISFRSDNAVSCGEERP